MTFTLDVSTLSGAGERETRLDLLNSAKWVQFKIEQSENKDLKLIGLYVYYVIEGEQR